MRRKSKVERYAGFVIRKRAYDSGKTAWQLEIPLGERGKRKRTEYPTLEAAKAAADLKSAAKRNDGNNALALAPRQQQDAVAALALLQGAASLEDAARAWLRYNPQGDAGLTFAALVADYVAGMTRRGLRKPSIDGARRRLARMVKDMGQLPAVQITAADLENWLDSQEVKVLNRKNMIIAMRGLFNWAMEKEKIKIERNPADKIEFPIIEKVKPPIFKAATVAKIMHSAEKLAPECVPFLALCFFAGLRPTNEAGRVTWGAIDLDAERITIAAEISKTHSERFVKIKPNLKSWLLRYRLANKGAQVAPAYGSLVKRLRAIKKAAGIMTWPKDVARHTYASAFLELSQSIEETCLQMGNTAPMLFKHYRGLLTEKDASAHFSIMPHGIATADADTAKAVAS